MDKSRDNLKPTIYKNIKSKIIETGDGDDDDDADYDYAPAA